MNLHRPVKSIDNSPISELQTSPIGKSDIEIAEAMEEYLSMVESNPSFDRRAFFAKHSAISSQLQLAVEGLDIISRLSANGVAISDQPSLHSDNLQSSVEPVDTKTIGDFRIIRELGRGGMGVVYEAEQISLGRRMAVKLLQFAALLDDSRLQRFRNEARAAAMLNHPQIVRCHSVGIERGVHYYVMDLIEGKTLSELIVDLRGSSKSDDLANTKSDSNSEHPADAQDTEPIAALSTVQSHPARVRYATIARLGTQAARALHYAHQQGVIHRDIKPSNLMLDRQGQLHITDFGLARIQADPSLTASSDVLGTLRYMSPEQLSPDSIVDHRTDVFSLGLTLFELIAGKPARNAETRPALLRQVVEMSNFALKDCCRDVPSDLETVILKATHLDPGLRYASAADLADDLERFASGHSILARRASAWENTRRWVSRNPTVASLLAAVFGLLWLIASGSLVASSHFRNQAKALHREVLRSEDVIYARDILAAQQAIRDGNIVAAEAILLEHVANDSVADRRGFEWFHLWQAAHDPALERTIAHQLIVSDLEFLEHSNHLAIGAWSDHLRVWDLDREPQSRSEFDLWTGQKWTRTLVHIPSRKSLLTIDPKGICREFSLEAKVQVGDEFPICEFPTTEQLLCRAVISDHRRAIVIAGGSSKQGFVSVLDSETLQTIASSTQFAGRAHAVLTANGRLFVAAENVDELLELDPETFSVINCFPIDGTGVSAMALSHDGCTLAIATGRRQEQSQFTSLVLWNIESCHVEHRIGLEGDPLVSLAFSPDDQLLAAGQSQAGTIYLFDSQLKLRRKNMAHGGSVRDVSFTHDSKRLATAGTDGAVHIWSVARLVSPNQTITHSNAFFGFVGNGVFLDNDVACLSVRGGDLIQWDTNDGQTTKKLHFDWPGSTQTLLTLSPDRKIAAVALEAYPEINETKVEIIDVATNESILSHEFQGGDSGSSQRAFSPDGQFYVHFIKNQAYVFDMRKKELVHQFELPGSGKSLSFHPSNRTCVFADVSGKLHQYSVPGFQFMRTVKGDDRLLIRAVHSPDGRQIATVGFDCKVNLFAADRLSPLPATNRFPQTGVYLCDVTYSPNGTRLVTASPSGDIRILDVESGQELLAFKTVVGYYPSIAFSPSGEKLLVACGSEAYVVHATGRESLKKLTVAELQDIACQNVIEVKQ